MRFDSVPRIGGRTLPHGEERTLTQEGVRKMRRTIPYAVAVVATIVVVLAVMVGVGIGQPTSSHGGSPSEVFMQTDQFLCSDTDWGGMSQELTLAETSHLLVYFTATWFGLGSKERGYLWFNLDGTDTDADWEVPGDKSRRTTGTMMWTFEDVAAGSHTVYAKSGARRLHEGPGSGSADLHSCALTVMVIPPEQ